MKKIISYILIFIFSVSMIFSNNIIIVHADTYYEKVPYDDLDIASKVMYSFELAKQLIGAYFTVDFAGAGDIFYDYVRWVTGEYPEKTLSEMSEEEQEGFYTDILDSLSNKGLTFNSTTNTFTATASFKKEMKEFMQEFIEKYEEPLYTLIQSQCITDLKASTLGYSYYYITLQNFLKEHEYCTFYVLRDGSEINLYTYDLDDCFLVETSSCDDYIDARLYNKRTETRYINFKIYTIDFSNEKSPITDFGNDDRVSCVSYDNNYFYYNNFVYGDINDVFRLSTLSYFISNTPLVLRIFSSLKNYQDYICSTQERNVYYTSNYYTTNYTDSSMSYEDLALYVENIDKILQVLAKESTENNYDEDALTRRLDALINALWSSNGEISDDLDDILSGTTTWLEKIYNVLNDFKSDLLKKLDNLNITSDSDVSVDIDGDIFDDWNKDLNNVVNDIVNDTDVSLSLFLDGLTSDFDEVGKVAKSKFPFCIPWDVEFLIAFLADTPQTPIFTVPLKLESYNIDYSIEIDLSQFETVSKISRTFLTVLYILALMNFSTKIVEMKEGSNNG